MATIWPVQYNLSPAVRFLGDDSVVGGPLFVVASIVCEGPVGRYSDIFIYT